VEADQGAGEGAHNHGYRTVDPLKESTSASSSCY
jgi:hypothetical protein